MNRFGQFRMKYSVEFLQLCAIVLVLKENIQKAKEVTVFKINEAIHQLKV